ncbi:unnamed protein product, partial [marine sediment metagenome]
FIKIDKIFPEQSSMTISPNNNKEFKEIDIFFLFI